MTTDELLKETDEREAEIYPGSSGRHFKRQINIMACQIRELVKRMEDAKKTLERMEATPNYITLGEIQDWSRDCLARLRVPIGEGK